MSTTGRPPFDARRATELARRSSDDPRWRDVHRHIELAQAGALATDLLKSLDPALVEGPEILGRVLVSGRRLGPAARARLADDVFAARQLPITSLVAAAFPRGSESRLRLGHVLLGSAAGRAAGVPIRLLEAAVETAVAELTLGLPPGTAPAAANDLAPKARFLDGHRVVFEDAAMLSAAPLAPEAPAAPLAEAGIDPAAALDQILLPRVRAGEDRVAELLGQLKRTRLLLTQVSEPGLLEGYGVKRAHALLEHAQFRAEVARELLRACRSAARTPGIVGVARVEIAHLRADALTAFELLQSRAARGHALGPNPGDFGDIDRRVLELHTELARLQAKGEVLRAAAEDPACALDKGDLASLGCAYGPAKAAPQTLWDPPFLEALAERGRRLGAVREPHARRHEEVASVSPARGQGSSSAASPALSAAELAALLKRTGVDLARVDPLQLAAAARTLGHLHGKERRNALAKMLEGFRVLATVGMPPLSREEALRLLRLALSSHPPILGRLSEGDLQDKLQEVASLVNAGPGPALVKLGAGTLRFTVAPNGRLVRVTYAEPGAFSSLRAALRGMTPFARMRLRLRRAPVLGEIARGRRPIRATSGALAFAAYRLASGEMTEARQRLGAALVACQGEAASGMRPLVEEAQARAFGSLVAGAVAAVRAAARFETVSRPHGRQDLGRRFEEASSDCAHAVSDLDGLLDRADLPPDARAVAAAARIDLEQALLELRSALRTSDLPDLEDPAYARFEGRFTPIDADRQRIRAALVEPAGR